MGATVEFPLQIRPATPQLQPLFAPIQAEQLKKAFGFENVQVYEEEEVKMKGMLGHYIMMPLKLGPVSWNEQLAPGESRTRTAEEMYLPIAMVEISRTKNMEMTAVEGRDGTVKEYGSHGDYMVNIKSILIGEIDEDGTVAETGKYPTIEKAKLIDLEAAKVEIPVAGFAFENLGIEYLVIRSIRWVPMEGVENAQAFELDCVSDNPGSYKLRGGL